MVDASVFSCHVGNVLSLFIDWHEQHENTLSQNNSPFTQESSLIFIWGECPDEGVVSRNCFFILSAIKCAFSVTNAASLWMTASELGLFSDSR